ncbi:MAG: transcription elongation factor subunit Spt4 [Candidatus Thermoplasmatota archaeon]
MAKKKACKDCNYLTEENECPLCGGEVSREWQGYLVIVDHEHSMLAKKMGIRANGKFALKVRG